MPGDNYLDTHRNLIGQQIGLYTDDRDQDRDYQARALAAEQSLFGLVCQHGLRDNAPQAEFKYPCIRRKIEQPTRERIRRILCDMSETPDRSLGDFLRGIAAI